jgi:hypothetical protein
MQRWLMALGVLAGWVAWPSAGRAQEAERKAFVDKLRATTPSPKPAPPAAGAPASAEPAAYAFSDGTVDGQLGTVEMRSANRAAAEILQKRMERERPDELKLIRQAAGADVVVVSGSYDRVQDVLRAVQVKHVVIPPHLIDQLDLLPTQTVMINCPGRVSDRATGKLRDFVKRGGYLVTTDWALKLTERAFPKTVAHNGRTTPNDVVAVHVHDEKEPLLRHVGGMDQPRWWLEGSSYPVKVIDTQLVRVLLSSKEMEKKYGDGAIAVAFRYGDGKVLHMTSHFFLQQSKLVSEREKRRGSAFAKDVGLSEGDVADLRKRGVDVDQARSGEVSSAYSMQQMSANLLAEKQRANDELIKKKYTATVTREVTLAPSYDAPAPAKAPRLGKTYRVRVKERKNGRVLVEDLFGNEGWVGEDAFK